MDKAANILEDTSDDRCKLLALIGHFGGRKRIESVVNTRRTRAEINNYGWSRGM